MLKHFIMWALICITAPVACAQKYNPDDSTGCDTAGYSISSRLLDEVTVTAPITVNRPDRKIIRLKKETLSASSGGINLLRKLPLAGITINHLIEDISVVGGGIVVLCINGGESTSGQIASIMPRNILRSP